MSIRSNTKTNQGFTIIEVVLVLAIAALIFLMIFVALPALQASQRDTERKNDASLVMSGLTKFISAGGTIAFGQERNIAKYIPDLGYYQKRSMRAGGTSVRYPFQLTRNVRHEPREPQNRWSQEIVIHIASTCDGVNVVAATGRQFAVRIQLEDKTLYCISA